VIVEVGERITAQQLTALGDLLSVRWSLHEVLPSGAIGRAFVGHDAWPLRR
jgi:hypothetical protein